jgi:predicted nucleic acid-binding protein
MFVSCHTLAEFYRVLTSIKVSPRFTNTQVWRLLEDDILQIATVVELTRDDYSQCLLRLTQANERGGVVFDALHVQAALKAGVDKLLTLNSGHFIRVWPNHTDEVIHPQSTQAP